MYGFGQLYIRLTLYDFHQKRRKAIWGDLNPTTLVQCVCVVFGREITRICRVGQNRIYTPYTTVGLVNFLPKIPYMHRICMVLANP
jgi:hypothetical protein